MIKWFHELSSYPYISPYSFRLICDWAFMHPSDYQHCKHPLLSKLGDGIIADRLKTNQKIFVVSDLIDQFFSSIHNRIKAPYVLVIGRGDTPFSVKYKKYLDDDNIVHCFSSNTEFSHSKLTTIPLGLQNRHWRIYEHPQSDIKLLSSVAASDIQKTNDVFMSFSEVTNRSVRKPVVDLFSSKNFVTHRKFTQEDRTSKSFVKEYFEEIKKHKFVICPRGNGHDCHRNWESLYLGSFPIVQRHESYESFKDYPIWFVDSWEEVNKQSIETKYNECIEKNKVFSREKLYMDYWSNLIYKF